MALIVGQQSNFKYFCKICKKGFGCGRALGGHMRAHGIGDETAQIDDDDDDDDPEADWEERVSGNLPPSNKHVYALRTNPNRLKSCKVCENCGKEFLSWKLFLEHGNGKCTSEDAEYLASSPASDDNDGDDDDNDVSRRGCGWSKRKRTCRTKVGDTFNKYNCPSTEEEDLAKCLMMLSNAIVDPIAEPEEFGASTSKDEERRNPMNFIAPFSCPSSSVDNKAKGVANGLFECKACKKVFNSHQALGGHRASHKKVKGCFAARLDNNNFDDTLNEDDAITNEEFFPTKPNPSTLQFDHGSTLPSSSKRKSKLHECSICHRSFSSGQALGGHKRCHWITSSNSLDTSTLARFQQFQDHIEQIPKFDISSESLDLKLDLNLPATTTNKELSRRNVSSEILMQPWVGTKNIIKDDDNSISHCQNHHQPNQIENNIDDKNNNISNALMQNDLDNDEEDSNVKLAKLSELNDMNNDGSSSPWLKVGFSSTTNVEGEK